MKFAPHIGLSSPDDFMFPASAGNNPTDQIKFIAEQGFSGIEDNFLKLKWNILFRNQENQGKRKY